MRRRAGGWSRWRGVSEELVGEALGSRETFGGIEAQDPVEQLLELRRVKLGQRLRLGLDCVDEQR